MDSICLISTPRTGTNHLCEVLKNFADLAPFLDVFDTGGASGTDPQTWPLLRRLTGIDFANGRDPRLGNFAQQHPVAWLDALEQAALMQGKRLMSFKLFPQHLPIETLERQIMPRHGLRVIMVMRKQIDSYISWRKAIEIGRSQGVDTTGMRLKLEADRFEDWLVSHERWYQHWRDYLGRRFMPCPLVRYELDIDQPAERILRRFAATTAQVGVTLRPPATIAHQGLERQDQARSMVEKVTNWPEFSKEIFARGLEKRAFGYPI